MAFTLKHFVFFDNNNTSNESEVLSSLENAEEMTLQVSGSGTINLSIKAKSDAKNGLWQDISAISLSGYTLCNTITQNGIYNIPLIGLSSIKVVNNGSTGINVHGKIIG